MKERKTVTNNKKFLPFKMSHGKCSIKGLFHISSSLDAYLTQYICNISNIAITSLRGTIGIRSDRFWSHSFVVNFLFFSPEQAATERKKNSTYHNVSSSIRHINVPSSTPTGCLITYKHRDTDTTSSFFLCTHFSTEMMSLPITMRLLNDSLCNRMDTFDKLVSMSCSVLLNWLR